MFTRAAFCCKRFAYVKIPVRFVVSNKFNRVSGCDGYKSRELEAVRNVMLQQKNYRLESDKENIQQIFVRPESYGLSQSVRNIKKLIVNKNNFDESLSRKIDQITRQVLTVGHRLNDDELIEVLVAFSEIELLQEQCKSVKHLRNALSTVFVKKLPNWNVDQILRACNVWHEIQRSQYTDFAIVACTTLAKNVTIMTPQQIVQTLLNIGWRMVPAHNMDEFEQRLIECIDRLSINELGIVALGFFRSDCCIQSDDLVQTIYQRILAEDLLTVEPLMLTLLLKILRKSTQSVNKKWHAALLDKLVDVARNAQNSIPYFTHMALLGTKTRICNNNLMTAIVERFRTNIKEARIKDLERIVLAITKLNFKSGTGIEDELCREILQEIKRPERKFEIEEFPQGLAACIQYLAYKDLYCPSLFAYILSPTIVRTVFEKRSTYDVTILFLDSYARINLKEEYSGPYLEKSMCADISGRLQKPIIMDDQERLLSEDLVLASVSAAIKKCFGQPEFVHVLPYSSTLDLILILEKQKNVAAFHSTPHPPWPLGEYISSDKFTKGNTNLTALAFVVSYLSIGKTLDMDEGFQCKIKQLQLLGFVPIVISHREWRNIFDFEHCRVIQEKIDNALR